MEEKHIKKLYRSTTDRVLLGVCGGLGEYYEMDSNVIRLIFILLGLLTGPVSFILYILIAFLIPNKPGIHDKKVTDEIKEKAEEVATVIKNKEDSFNHKKSSKNLFGVAIIIIGILIILSQIMPMGLFFLRMFWPAAIIALGVYLIIK